MWRGERAIGRISQVHSLSSAFRATDCGPPQKSGSRLNRWRAHQIARAPS
jgi:hypothetical protein